MQDKQKKKRTILNSLEFVIKGDFFIDTFQEFFPDLVQGCLEYPYDLIVIGFYILFKLLKSCSKEKEEKEEDDGVNTTSLT